MDPRFIRNFSIIAHIDHGKSTLADRFLEITETVEKRHMQEQVLDSMELERERGITIKMQPVRMKYQQGTHAYILNLIDTPGHIDFSYEVSRALKAVEGAILLVDATQGVQAQTLTVLQMARQLGLTILPVVSKIDSPLARTPEVKEEVAKLLNINVSEVMEVSGKTGAGVPELLAAIITRIPAPIPDGKDLKSLIFDFQYSNHRGVVVYVRVFGGEVTAKETLSFIASNRDFLSGEVGIFNPDEKPVDKLGPGEIGYIVTGVKEPGIASVGDTVKRKNTNVQALPGYDRPRPVVWASIYPHTQDDLNLLRQALLRLRLTDASLSFEEESSGTLGRGFRCGFLGLLHLEIATERLRREFNLELIVTLPSIMYEVTTQKGTETVYSPSLFPDDHEILEVAEPWAKLTIIIPPQYIGDVMKLLYEHEAEIGATTDFGDMRTEIVADMPLRELMRNFFDEIKSVTSGYASISYEMLPVRIADVTRLDILVADEPVPAFARVVSKRRIEEEGRLLVDKLYKNLPKQLFTTKIQAKAYGRIIASETLSALKKNVTAHLYGGDITRKKKLWEQQKEGKKRLLERAQVNIPHDVFIKMVRSGE